MLVFPHIRPDIRSEGCRASGWMPPERFAPYFARPSAFSGPPPQHEDEYLSGGSSPEHAGAGAGAGAGASACACACGWGGCGAWFPSVSRLSAHVARAHAHAHSDGLFYCGWSDCTRPQRGFNARYKMLVHIRTHTNERPHTCNQCQKSFSRAENLKIHLRSHSGEKPYVCPYEGCGKAYSNSSDRFKHTRTHTVDKPYCCKVPGCNKRYTDPSSLRKHVKTYKHAVSEMEIPKNECIEDRHSSDSLSPLRENNQTVYGKSLSPHTYMPNCLPSGKTSYNSMSYSNPALGAPLGYLPILDQVPYVRPLERIYPIRVPSHDLGYSKYTQMYEDYRNYYPYSLNYTALRPDVNEKVLYEEQNIEEVHIDVTEDTEVPLNLICTKRLECKPISELVKHAELPLDLSTKS